MLCYCWSCYYTESPVCSGPNDHADDDDKMMEMLYLGSSRDLFKFVSKGNDERRWEIWLLLEQTHYFQAYILACSRLGHLRLLQSCLV